MGGVSQGGKEVFAGLKNISQLPVLGNHVDRRLLAGRHVHGGAHAPDRSDGFLNHFRSLLLSCEAPLLPVNRPAGNHDGLLLVLEVAENLLGDKGHKGMQEL